VLLLNGCLSSSSSSSSSFTSLSTQSVNFWIHPRMYIFSFLYKHFCFYFSSFFILLLRAVIAQSVQCWATDWTIGVLGFDFRRGLRIFLSPPRPEWLWGPLSLLSNGNRGLFLWGSSGRGVKLITHLHLVPRSRMHGAIPPLPQYVFMAWCLVKHRDIFLLHLLRPVSPGFVQQIMLIAHILSKDITTV
jgi:hypothetical protein